MTALIKPRGLLVDFGGVIVETANRPGWQSKMAQLVHERLAAADAGSPQLGVADIERDIREGAKADSRWKDAMSRPFAPVELTYQEFWEGFVAGDWPVRTREYVRDNAKELCREMGEMKQERVTRDGFIEVLDFADAASIPVVIVSNTLMGQVHRDFLTRNHLTDRFVEQIYSDEVRVRKPNPEMIHLGARAIGETAATCWYVGDNFDRDVLCGARAGVGGNILMEARSTYDLPYELTVKADAIVADPWGLRELLRVSLERAA
ncbi:Phosphoglycolate phosphatase [Microbacterium hydrocarbonoxydans]|uniref:Phosphoglycolate phosphatase n=1 Tax=Microbacterium hydrocarbonoxydans TaxID=273678 RepID=A0A0M2HV07_9MICO|nr:HAD family hydrolase [Microbacterium hydrocarbonoxydans]KJL48735.1 Phosphoglycolate phosphatase [Microbacterium hydrocarbonoxydans]